MEDKRSENKKKIDAKNEQQKIENASNKINRKKDNASKKLAIDDGKAIREAEAFEREIKQLLKDSGIKNYKTRSAQRILSNFKYRKSIDVGFNTKINNYFTKNNKSFRKVIARFNTVNYKASTSGKQSLESFKNSIRHSLRIEQKDSLEWDNTLTKDNLYFCDNEIFTDEEFQKINKQLFNKIVADKESDILNETDIQHKKDVKKASDYRTNYKKKVLNIAPNDEKLTKALNLLDKGKHRFKTNEQLHHHIKKIRKYVLNHISKSDISDKKKDNQKKLFESYLKYRNEHTKIRSTDRKFKSKSTAFIQEATFKFIHKNGDLSEIDPALYIESTNAWYQRNFPNHKIIFGTVHNDEKIDVDGAGINFHFFQDAKNSKTGIYDLREAQIEFVKKEQHRLNKLYNLDFDIKSKGNQLKRHEMTEMGQILQVSFYHNLQLALIKANHNIALNFLNPTERKKFSYVLSCAEQHLPLSMRQNSRFNAFKQKNEELELKNNNLDLEISEKVDLLFKKINDWKNGEIKDYERKNLAKNISKDIKRLKEQHKEAGELVSQTCVNFENSLSIKEEYKISKHLENQNHDEDLCIHNKTKDKCPICNPKGSSSGTKVKI